MPQGGSFALPRLKAGVVATTAPLRNRLPFGRLRRLSRCC